MMKPSALIGLALSALLLAFAPVTAGLPVWPPPKPPAEELGNPKLTKQDMRIQHRLLTLKSGEEDYDPRKLLKAKEDAKAMSRSSKAWPSQAAGDVSPLRAGIEPTAWTAIGPKNIGGRTRSLVIHPATPSTMYAGAATGGVWKTVNGGATWTPLNDFLPNLGVATLVMDKANPNVLYLGTGEVLQGIGVFKTIDGGLTWNHLASTANSDWYYVKRIAISPANSQILLATTWNGLFRSSDGGATWTRKGNGSGYDVEFHPTDGNRAWASTGVNAVLYTTDAGNTWTAAAGLPGFGGRVELAVARSNPGIVFAALDINGGELWRSSDGGRSFTPRNQNLFPLWNQGWWDNAIWVSPLNPDHVIWGGVGLYYSTDGGFVFDNSGSGDLHADQHWIVEPPTFSATNRTVFVTNDGGVYRSNDYLNPFGAGVWTGINTDYSVTQFYAGGGHARSGMVMGGTQDNGTPRYFKSANDWQGVGCCDGVWTVADPAVEPDGSFFFYGGTQNGPTWRVRMTATGVVQDGLWYLNGAGNDSYPFIHVQILDLGTPRRLYKGGTRLWRLDNPNTADASAPFTPVTPSGSYIHAIAVAPSNSNIVWIGRGDGSVWSSSNALAGTPTWTRRGATTLPGRIITRIAIDPATPNRVYATMGGFDRGNVWKTEDGGITWADISSNLPALPVRSLVIHPHNTQHIYIGTEVGIYASENRGGSWSPSNEGPSNVATDELFWVGNKLTAATHGRGMWQVTINTPPVTALTAPANNANFPAGSNITLAANASDPDGTVARVEFYSGTTRLGEDATSPYSFSWNNVPAGAYQLTSRAFDNDSGSAASAVVNITVGGTPATARNPVADSHVRDGSYAGTNFGTSRSLEAKTNASAGFNRDAYLRFEVNNLAGLVSNAKLRVYGRLSQATTVNLAAHQVANNAWTEAGITWNNRPALGPVLSTRPITGTSDAWYEFDVTPFVRKEKARGQASMTLGLHGTANFEPSITLSSREAVTAANRPQLSFNLVTPQALLVVGNAALVPGDAAVRNRLQAMGFTVVVKDAASAVTGDATGKAVVLVSSTVVSGSVGNRFRTVAVPVVNWEQAIQDDMSMTGTVAGTDFGTSAGQTQVKILNAAHALAGGLAGTQTVTTAAGDFNFGRPSAAAIRIGSLAANDAQVSVYGYETGAAMVGLNAPARRVNLFMGDASPGVFNDNGWALFDAAVYWAAGL